MDILFWVLLGIILIFFIRRAMPTKGVDVITTTDLQNKLKNKDIQFIDVRTPGEYKVKNIKPFKNIPLQSLQNNIRQLDPKKETVVICQSGMRSLQATKILKKNGFEHVANVSGGMNAW